MAAVALSGIDHDPSFGQSFKKKRCCVCAREGWERGEKSIGFHYVLGRCHWPVNDPATAAAAAGDTDLHSSSAFTAAAADKRETR